MVPPIASNDDSEVGGGSGGGPPPATVNTYTLELFIHADDFAELAKADGILTLANTVTLTGITGAQRVTLSKLVPVLPA